MEKRVCHHKNEDIEPKRANVVHHDVEAEISELCHPEVSSFYEKCKLIENLAYIAERSRSRNLCVDIGCGTGFVTSLELSTYKTVVALDISRRMLDVARRRLGQYPSLNLVVCDAEFLPLTPEIADLASISSVLHHLPNTSVALTEASEVLKKQGFLYLTREPNFQRFRRFFDYFDQIIAKKIAHILCHLLVAKSKISGPSVPSKGLNYTVVDIHYPTGFDTAVLTRFLQSRSLEILIVYSYHWIFPESGFGLLQQLQMRSNFIVKKMPLAKKFGRYVTAIARRN
jgi:SAM-dependent methyltransferase